MRMRRHNEQDSQFAKHIRALISEKRGLGLKFYAEGERLWDFNRFILEQGFKDTVVTKEISEKWSIVRPNESEANRILRFGTVQRFSKFLVRMGYSSYVSCAKVSWRTKDFKAYIFTDDESNRFLQATHKITFYAGSKVRYLVVPMLFTILFCTGIRIGEALSLKRESIIFDGECAFLDVYSEKHNKTRRLPLAPDLSVRLRKYLDEMEARAQNSNLLFPAPHGGQYTQAPIYRAFREILWEAGISYGGRGKGPRIHDIRHTFAVKSLRKLVLSKVNPQEAFPFLSTYLGHKNLSATQTYIQLTAELFPYIVQNMEEYCGQIVPLMEVPHDKAD